MPLKVQLQAEDYGGVIALPHYGFKRPSPDYFNSNLMAYNLFVCDITSGMNSVYLNDERQQGKGADALCSLRMRHCLRKLKKIKESGNMPTLLMTLLEYCVRNYKSQTVMKFYSMFSQNIQYTVYRLPTLSINCS